MRVHVIPASRVPRRGVVLALFACLLASLAPPARAQVNREYPLKAAFLLNFVKFVDWPSLPGGTITIGILGRNPFSPAVLDGINGKPVKDRTLVVRQVSDLREAAACQVVFISSSEKERLRPILDGLRGASILTVGETAGFARSGGIINFIEEGNKIRFEINPDAAERARLSISSQLLRLAKVVRT
jgi:hypothetical protein